MKFVCGSCNAQYMISDDKVGPNGVVVRCKKCSNKITVKKAAPVEEDHAESTVVMQNPLAGMTDPNNAAPPAALAGETTQAAGPTLSAGASVGGGLSGIGTLPAMPAIGGPPMPFDPSGAIDDDIGKAFDSVMSTPQDGSKPANGVAAGGGFPFDVNGESANGQAKGSGDGYGGDGEGDESQNRESTRVVDLSTIANLTKAPEKKDGAGEKKDEAPSNAAEWFVAIRDNQVGPLSIDGVRGHWEKGELSADSLVWRNGMADWKPLSTVPQLASVLAPVPKPALEEAAKADKKEPPAGATATGAQAPVSSVASPPPSESSSSEPEWKPSAASALASLVKDELEALKKPAAPPKDDTHRPEVLTQTRQLIDIPDGPESDPGLTAKKPLVDLPADPEPAHERPLPRRRPAEPDHEHDEPAAPKARYNSQPAFVAPAEAVPAKSNGVYIALGIGGGLLGLGGIITAVLLFVVKPNQPAVVVQPVPVAQPVQTTPPPVVTPPAQTTPPPAETKPAVAETRPADTKPAETKPAETKPTEVAKADEPKQEPKAEAKAEPKAEPRQEPIAKAEPVQRNPRFNRGGRSEPRQEPVAKAEPPPPPPPREEPSSGSGGKSKVDEDFDKIFGTGGGSSEPAQPKQEKKTKTAYVPPPVGGASAAKTKLEQGDIMEVVLANKPAIKNCVEQQKAQDPSATGTLVMRWIIRPNGSTGNIQTMSPEFRKTPMSSCMAQAIKTWKFSEYSGPQMAPIDFPFKF